MFPDCAGFLEWRLHWRSAAARAALIQLERLYRRLGCRFSNLIGIRNKGRRLCGFWGVLFRRRIGGTQLRGRYFFLIGFFFRNRFQRSSRRAFFLCFLFLYDARFRRTAIATGFERKDIRSTRLRVGIRRRPISRSLPWRLPIIVIRPFLIRICDRAVAVRREVRRRDGNTLRRQRPSQNIDYTPVETIDQHPHILPVAIQRMRYPKRTARTRLRNGLITHRTHHGVDMLRRNSTRRENRLLVRMPVVILRCGRCRCRQRKQRGRKKRSTQNFFSKRHGSSPRKTSRPPPRNISPCEYGGLATANGQ